MLSLNIIYIGYMSQWGENYVTYQGLKKINESLRRIKYIWEYEIIV